ncbi:MAG: hypothetical protein ACYSU4_15235 [Planctomycetota bacterium]|jgi:hypothetical protein
MSLKNTKNLLIIAAVVVVALTAGTVLLGNYTNILSSSSETDSQPKTCQAAKNATCTASQAFFAENAEGECTRKAECGSAEKTCQPDCTKPCCAGEAKTGCCPKSGDAAAEAGCCPKTDATVAAKTGCCPSTVTE